jgi:hypothetical protein
MPPFAGPMSGKTVKSTLTESTPPLRLAACAAIRHRGELKPVQSLLLGAPLVRLEKPQFARLGFAFLINREVQLTEL